MHVTLKYSPKIENELVDVITYNLVQQAIDSCLHDDLRVLYNLQRMTEEWKALTDDEKKNYVQQSD